MVSQKALDTKAYKISQLKRKLDEQDSKVSDLEASLSTLRDRNTQSNIKNEEMKKQLNQLQSQYGIMDEHDDDITSDEGVVHTNIHGWGVVEVVTWWRRNLPKAAQEYVAVVRECQMSGKDLLGLDMGMLQQFGMKKLLARQIIAQIEPLRIEAEAQQIDPEHAKVYTTMEQQEEDELTQIRGRDLVNPKSQAKMDGLLSNVLKKRT